MPEVDDYLKLAASSFKIAEERFKDAEDALRALEVELEHCADRLAKIPHIDLLSWKQLGIDVTDYRPVDKKELYLVSS